MTQQTDPAGIRRYGPDAASHFFGYYNKSPWDAAGRQLLAHRTPLRGGALHGGERAEIGLFDVQAPDRFHPLAQTSAWNWQMGAQLQWLGGGGRRIIYNDRRDAGTDPAFATPYCARILDLDKGSTTALPLPVYVVAPDGDCAYCVNYSRLAYTHPTIGYFDGTPVRRPADCPADDGIYRLQIGTGEVTQVVGLADLAALQPRASMAGAVHWVSHLEVSPDGRRLLFLHRWTRRVEDETCFLHRLLSCDADGGNLRLLECTDHPLPQLETEFDPNAVGLFDYEASEYQISHPLWIDNDRLIVWGPHRGVIGYHIYDLRDAGAQRIGDGVLTENGHMSFAPGGGRMVSDTYPDAQTNLRELFLWDAAGGKQVLARLLTRPDLAKTDRCDLHPRWSRDGTEICIDSVHQGARAIYVIPAPATIPEAPFGIPPVHSTV